MVRVLWSRRVLRRAVQVDEDSKKHWPAGWNLQNLVKYACIAYKGHPIGLTRISVISYIYSYAMCERLVLKCEAKL